MKENLSNLSCGYLVFWFFFLTCNQTKLMQLIIEIVVPKNVLNVSKVADISFLSKRKFINL